jgi:hypothetical protein
MYAVLVEELDRYPALLALKKVSDDAFHWFCLPADGYIH